MMSSPSALLTKALPPHVTGYVPASQLSGTTYVSVRITPSFAAAFPPTGAEKAYSNVEELLTSEALYASPFTAPVYAVSKGFVELITNCAPPTMRAVAFASFTNTLRFTVSPALAVTVSICQMIEPG